MVAPGNTNKHKSSYSNGVKAVEEQKWGRSTARERYGSLEYQNGAPAPADRHAPQRLGDANNLQGPGYVNRHRNDWVRGFGKGGIESAEGKPNFQPGYKGKR
jgi:hypothetical protein